MEEPLSPHVGLQTLVNTDTISLQDTLIPKLLIQIPQHFPIPWINIISMAIYGCRSIAIMRALRTCIGLESEWMLKYIKGTMLSNLFVCVIWDG